MFKRFSQAKHNSKGRFTDALLEDMARPGAM
jgi:hypothetical protein